MDETVLLNMLDEIDSMTSEEYWKLFNESQKLPDYLLGSRSVVFPENQVIPVGTSFSMVSLEKYRSPRSSEGTPESLLSVTT
jgi:hypothetical protein